MTFRVGQKVVCIEAKIGECCECQSLRHEPDKGDIGTVVNIFEALDWDDRRATAIELAEFPSDRCCHFGPGWLADGFRPLVERKTDISVFEEMLTPQGVVA